MTPDDYERLAVQVAAQMAARVREETPEDNLAWLHAVTTAEEREALPWILAAAVPVDEPMRLLLAWCRPEIRNATWAEAESEAMAEGGKRPLQPCGTRAAAKRHRYHKEELCAPCRRAERNRYGGTKIEEAIQHDRTSVEAGDSQPAACA